MSFRQLAATAVLSLVAACAHATKSPSSDSSASPAAAPAPAATPATPAAPTARACDTDGQCGVDELCVSSRCVKITPELAECRASTHFDFDRAVLLAGDLAGLQRAARCLKALPPSKTLVEGNCDERGTAQYNIALGFKRAHAAAKYLEDIGVPRSQLKEVSYGKELPACRESNESCWAMNRRVDVSRGGEPKAMAAHLRVHGAHEQPSAVDSPPKH